MANRSHLVIFVIGVVGFGIMGFLMKVALESNAEFVKLGKAKSAIAETYAPEGLDEVTVVLLPKRRGYEVRAVFRDLSPDQYQPTSRELARALISSYKSERRRHVPVVLLKGTGWGCTAPAEAFKRDFSIPDLLLEFSIDEAMSKLVGTSDGEEHFRIVDVLSEPTGEGGSTEGEGEAAADKSPRDTAEPAQPDPEESSAEIAAETADDTFQKAAAFVWESLRGVAVRSVTLVLRSSGSPNEITQEAKVERPQKPRNRLKRRRVRSPVRWNRTGTK